TLVGHDYSVTCVALTPDGRRAVSASNDRTLMVWEIQSGQVIRTLEGHSGSVYAVSLTSDAQILASQSADGTVRLWYFETGRTAAILPFIPKEDLLAVAFHPTAPILAMAGGKEGNDLHIWKLDVAVVLGEEGEPTLQYANAKVVLVGDSGVGKSG